MTASKDDPQFSLGSVRLFADLLGAYQLPATHPQFAEIASLIVTAREEIAAVLGEQPDAI